MKILARHLTADLFNCKNSKLTDIAAIKEAVQDILRDMQLKILHLECEELSAEHLLLVAVFADGHVTMHIYPELKYVALDTFLCREEADPDTITAAMRSFFKPDKTKTTVLKRGDFGRAKELKPKVKTKVAPLRKIHNTGAKVIRILARRKR